MTPTLRRPLLPAFFLLALGFLPVAAPLLAQSQPPGGTTPSDENWSSAFGGIFGFNEDIWTMAASGDAVYVGGAFYDAAGSTRYNRQGRPVRFVAQWDGSDWKPLGGGVNRSVHTLAATGTDVYVGGRFTKAGGQPANNIAKWDGQRWEALSAGLDQEGKDPRVVALAANGTDVYASGTFSMAGDQQEANVVKWNGEAWEPLRGLQGFVGPMAISGSDLYVAGRFDMAGGQPTTSVARWDGQRWEIIGTGFPYAITSIAADGSNVYVNVLPPRKNGDGSSTHTGDPTVSRWNGERWDVLDDPTTSPSSLGEDVRVKDVAVIGAYVYASFGVLSGNAAPSDIRRWNGARWEALPWIGGHGVTALTSSRNGLFAATSVGGSGAAVARWDGSSWHSLDGPNNGLNHDAVALAARGTDVYVGGFFTTAGEQWVSGIAKWDGQRWEALGGGVNGPVHALAVHGSDVYVGGYFDKAGDVEANSIARWDGRRWHALDNGVAFVRSDTSTQTTHLGAVHALAVRDGDVYAGGSFNRAGGLVAGSIARWDGSSWHVLGSGIATRTRQDLRLGSVLTISINGEAVYVGGDFNEAGGQPARSLAKWDGSAWTPVGALTSSFNRVHDLATSGDSVYVAGLLRYTDDAFHIAAVWVGEQWVDLPGLESANHGGPTFAVAHGSSGLYLGGGRLTIGARHDGIARWNGAGWEALGSGLYWEDEQGGRWEGVAHVLLVTDAGVYVGGDFIGAGNKSSNHIAFWRTATGTPSDAPPDERPSALELQAAYPNPSRGRTSITYHLPEPAHVRLDVYDLVGRRIATLLDEERPGGEGSVLWHARDLPSGAYLVRMQAGGTTRMQSVVLLK